MKNKDRLEFENEVHNQIIGWTNNCDTKSSIILAFVGVLVSIVFTSEYILNTIIKQIDNIVVYWCKGIGEFSFWATIMFVFLVAFVVLIGFSFIYSIKALKANIKCLDDSIIFFAKIASKTKDEYIDQVKYSTDEEIETDKLTQVYNCSQICNTKFYNYNRSVTYMKISLFVLLGFISSMILVNAISC